MDTFYNKPTLTALTAWSVFAVLIITLLSFFTCDSISLQTKGLESTAYTMTDDRPLFLKKQLEMERCATTIIYVTRKVTNALATDKFLVDLDNDRKRRKSYWTQDDLAWMVKRRDTLEHRIKNDEKLEQVVCLFAIEETQKDTSAVKKERLKHILNMAETYGKLHLYMVEEDRIEKLFGDEVTGMAIIITGDQVATVVARQATQGKPPITSEPLVDMLHEEPLGMSHKGILGLVDLLTSVENEKKSLEQLRSLTN